MLPEAFCSVPVTSFTRPNRSASGRSVARSFARLISFLVRRANAELLVANAYTPAPAAGRINHFAPFPAVPAPQAVDLSNEGVQAGAVALAEEQAEFVVGGPLSNGPLEQGDLLGRHPALGRWRHELD